MERTRFPCKVYYRIHGVTFVANRLSRIHEYTHSFTCTYARTTVGSRNIFFFFYYYYDHYYYRGTGCAAVNEYNILFLTPNVCSYNVRRVETDEKVTRADLYDATSDRPGVGRLENVLLKRQFLFLIIA